MGVPYYTLLKIKHTTLVYTNLDCFQKKKFRKAS